MAIRRLGTFPQVIFLIVLVSDQLTKWWAHHHGWVSWNQGISFGWGEQWPLGITISGLVLLYGGLPLFLTSTRAHSVGSSMLLAGALSNLIDRVVWGAVRDWLPIPFTSLTNNLADWMIAIGVSMVVVALVRPVANHQGMR